MDGHCRALSLEPGGILKTSVTLVFRATLSRHRQAMREYSETDAEVKLCVFEVIEAKLKVQTVPSGLSVCLLFIKRLPTIPSG